ncbi:RNA polymerase factor sigma-54 [Alcaligenaceae bacterium CGII-47]|nr:RNA polymerase factor sigma-54 [Alcaligenaceae bacterium CGII-47]
MQSHQSLELGQHQHLALTPQLQQAIQLLQCSSYELEQMLAQALLDNPMLELVDEPNTAAQQSEWLDRWWAPRARQLASDDIPETIIRQSLQEFLLQQLHLTRATPRDRGLVTLLIGELDEQGYLAQSLEKIAIDMPRELALMPDEWRTALSLLQSFDPPGIGARNLAECLVLQLDRLIDRCSLDEEVWACARELASASNLALLAAGKFARLCKALACTRTRLDAAHALLRRLNPRPAGDWGAGDIHYIVPDVLIYKAHGNWEVSLNPALATHVRVNPQYAQWLDQSEALEQPAPLREQLQQAHGFIRGLGQRNQTVLRVAQAIATHQQAFLETGPRALRPLVLRDIAQLLGLHESTISRATRLKYAQTPQGVFELKYFFGSVMQTDTGEETSALAVQTMIKTILAQEPPQKPWSDSQIAQLLADQGVVIARRTVAKYREIMGVPVTALRKMRDL